MSVATVQAEFTHNDPLSNLTTSNPSDSHHHPELKRRIYSALAEGDEGELSISIPKEVSLRQSGHAAVSGIVSEGRFIQILFPHYILAHFALVC